MPYQIEERDGYVEVSVSGHTSEWEALSIIFQLRMRDPRKTVPDLWTLASESVIHLPAFPLIADAVARLCPPGFAGAKTALVAADGFQKALMETYRDEMRRLPFEMGVFESRDEAVQWLKT